MTETRQNFLPSDEQRAAVIAIGEAYTNFKKQNPFSAPLDLTELTTAADAFGDLFPADFQAAVVKFYFADGTEPDFVELDDVYEDYAYAATGILLSVMAFNHAETLDSLNTLMYGLSEELYEIKQFMYDYYDADRDLWV